MRNKLTIGMIIGVALGVLITSTVVALGGSLDSSAAPALTSSYTLKDIYNRLHAGTDGSESLFTEPDSGPTTITMYNLNDIMEEAPHVDAEGAATADVITGKTFWGLTGGAWGKQTGTFPIIGRRSTESSIAGISKVLNEFDSDGSPADPDIQTADSRLLLNLYSSDVLPNLIGIPANYNYTRNKTVFTANIPYPASISDLIGNPMYDPYTGKPLSSFNNYEASWISSSSDGYYFNTTAPIALRLRSLRSQLDSTGTFSSAGRRATQNGTSSKILNGIDSDSINNGPDTETADLAQLLNPDSTDTLTNIIGVPSGYNYIGTPASAGILYPASISALLGTPTYDPVTGAPLVAGNDYYETWVSSSSGVYYFNTTAPIALRVRSVMSELATLKGHPVP